MALAAVPQYLGHDFSHASPALRFGMYLPLWGVDQRSKEMLWNTHDISYEIRGQQQQERAKRNENKVAALKNACALSLSDKSLAKALAQRQILTFSTAPNSLRLQATAIAPFTTGLGNEHPLENGFSFLNPYGLPYLAGSSVKGVLRRAADELASGEWNQADVPSCSRELRHEVQNQQGKPLFDASDLDVLFGSEALGGDNHLRGVLSFWDVIPQIEGNSLMVDIMTPHQSHYYQRKDHMGSVSPHDSGSPTPISFLTVPPGSHLAFHVVCDTVRLNHLAPDLAHAERWKLLLVSAFEHAFTWLGFGAKTSVGYGAMSRDTEAEATLSRLQAQTKAASEKASKMASLSDNARHIEKFVVACQKRLDQLVGARKDKPNTELHAKARALSKAALEGGGWTTEEKGVAAQALAEWLPQVVDVDMKDERKKLKLAQLTGNA